MLGGQEVTVQSDLSLTWWRRNGFEKRASRYRATSICESMPQAARSSVGWGGGHAGANQHLIQLPGTCPARSTA
jgi:hypothetical protein